MISLRIVGAIALHFPMRRVILDGVESLRTHLGDLSMLPTSGSSVIRRQVEIPPEETVWRRYSSNGESLVSGLASLILHGAALFLVLVGVRFLFFRSVETDAREAFEIVAVGHPDGGGSGTERAVGRDPGSPTNTIVDQAKPLEPDAPPPDAKQGEPPVIVKPNQGATIFVNDLERNWQQQRKRKPEVVDLGKQLCNMFPGAPAAGTKPNGPGRGNTTGPGSGGGNEPFRQGDPNRLDRNRRWDLYFGDLEATQYLARTDAMGMILCVADTKGKLKVIRDFRKPGLEDEDVYALKRNWFIDDKPESCEGVASALRLDFTPSAMIFFYPQSLEDELVKKEIAFRGRKESDIEYTKFRIGFSGGKHVISVMEQRPKKK